jgi:hypothetical protein
MLQGSVILDILYREIPITKIIRNLKTFYGQLP